MTLNIYILYPVSLKVSTDIIVWNDKLAGYFAVQVESLTSARKSAMSGNEPSDAIRVVNALLTQLDCIKKLVAPSGNTQAEGTRARDAQIYSHVLLCYCSRFPNVIILTTSNITGAIDLAFVDRADIKQYIGPPSSEAIYKIYQSCIDELIKASFPSDRAPITM